MRNSSTGRVEHTASADLWRNTLFQIPSVFGRLAYLAGLRDAATGRYAHHGLTLVFGEEEASRALRKGHVRAFEEWLSFDLEQQKADLDLFLSSYGRDKASVIENWLDLRTYKTFVPSSAKGAEKRLYRADLEAIIELLKNEYGVAGPDRDA